MKPFKIWRGRRASVNGEVSNARLKADAEAGVAYFYSKRPWLERPIPVCAQSKKLGKGRLDLAGAVRVAVAIGQPLRGALKGLSDANGLNYAEFYKAYKKAKRAAEADTRLSA